MVLINGNSTVLNIGDPMPEFVLPGTDGMTVDAQNIKDPIIVVVFTCNHCPYAQQYEDYLVDLANRDDQEGVQFILISSNDAQSYPDDSFEEMANRHDEKGYPFPYCYDESQDVAKAYGALCTPHCFVFDQERTLQYKGCIGPHLDMVQPTLHGEQDQPLKEAIDALVAGETPERQEVNAIGCSIKWR